ncbi:MAG: hypothetical protein D6785_13755 [Planctomycetota bacterium]|nr:MAG: hypothetical protein D6785_13755 [Planctomycetota bacterium]
MPENEVYLHLLYTNIVEGRQVLSNQKLRRYFRSALEKGLGPFVATFTGEELYKSPLKEDLEKKIKELISPLLLESGLDFLGVKYYSFFSPSYEKILQKERERQVYQEEEKNQKMLHDMKKRLLLEEVNAQKEAEELKKYLAYQGVLKELELRAEIQKKKKEEELQKYQELYEKMGKDEVKALIFLLEDEKIKAELIRELIEKDMTKEQLEAKKKDEFQKEMEAKIAQFTEQLNQLMKGGPVIPREPTYITKRVYVVAGQEVISFDPKTNRFPDQPKETYDFHSHSLGYLRSVRILDNGTLLAGGQRGVYLWKTSKDDLLKEFVFPRENKGRGGVNSSWIIEDTLYASHSEQGVVAWDILGFRDPQYILPEITEGKESVRGLLFHGGKIYFSVDHKICASAPPFEDYQLYEGSPSSITSFVVFEDSIIGANREGRILRWNLDDPTSPYEFSIRKTSSIYMLRIAHLGDLPYLLIGAKDYALQAVCLEGNQHVLEFHSKEPIRWVDGASDFVYGVDRSGYKVFVWAVDKPSSPLLIWRVGEKIQDIWVVREKAK